MTAQFLDLTPILLELQSENGRIATPLAIQKILSAAEGYAVSDEDRKWFGNHFDGQTAERLVAWFEIQRDSIKHHCRTVFWELQSDRPEEALLAMLEIGRLVERLNYEIAWARQRAYSRAQSEAASQTRWMPEDRSRVVRVARKHVREGVAVRNLWSETGKDVDVPDRKTFNKWMEEEGIRKKKE